MSKKEKVIEQNKLIAMNELLLNIGHQYRQPLSSISITASSMIMQTEYDILNKKEIISSCERIVKSTQYLSHVLDSFDNFINNKDVDHKNNTKFLSEIIFELIKKKDIQIKIKIDKEIKIKKYSSQITQVLGNIFQNSIDAFEDMKIIDKYIFVNVNKKKRFYIIKIKDNAQGVDKKSLSRIFEPYYTTKHREKGKGLGMDTVYRYIKYMGGTINIKNHIYTYNENEYKGLKITIKVPLK